jgi:hypothetical protein
MGEGESVFRFEASHRVLLYGFPVQDKSGLLAIGTKVFLVKFTLKIFAE